LTYIFLHLKVSVDLQPDHARIAAKKEKQAQGGASGKSGDDDDDLTNNPIVVEITCEVSSCDVYFGGPPCSSRCLNVFLVVRRVHPGA
jgi:hypothetical protein